MLAAIVIAIHTFFAVYMPMLCVWRYCTIREINSLRKINKELEATEKALPLIRRQALEDGFESGKNAGFNAGYAHCYDTQVPVRLSNGRFSKPGLKPELKPGSNTESPQREGGRVPLDMEIHEK